MSSKAHFKVDTKLAALLGENYRSTEYALKELVDNAWDADAKNVLIQLIKNQDQLSIFVEDDGKGFNVKKAFEKGGLGNVQCF